MRLLNRPLAFILAVALAAASVILIVEVIAFAADSGPVIVHWHHLVPLGPHNPLERPGDPGLVRHPDRHRRAHPRAGTQAPAHHPAAAALRRPGHRRRPDPQRPGRDPARRRHRDRRDQQRRPSPSAAAAPGSRRRRPRPGRRRHAQQPVTQAVHDRLDDLDLRAPAAPESARPHPEPLMHADRTNRFALTVFGLLVLLAGAAGMAASVGGFGTAFSRRTLFGNQVSAYIGQHGTWVWAAAAPYACCIALAALRWILALLVSTDRAGDLTVPGSKDHGTTEMPPTALTGALAREITPITAWTPPKAG